MKKEKSLGLISVLLLALISLMAVKMDVVGAYTLGDLDDAIDLALDWLDRHSYIEINSTHAVATDTPAPSFRLQHLYNNGYPTGEWTILKKSTVNLPSSATMIQGGSQVTLESDAETWVYHWDIDENTDYEDILIYVSYEPVNASWSRINGTVHSMDAFPTRKFHLYLENDKVIHDVAVDDNFVRYKEWGWTGRRYTIRPTCKGLADLYYQLDRTMFNSTHTYAEKRGVNYTDRAARLYRSWYGSGYILDRFDGIYNVTLKERPFSSIHGGIPENPDLIKEVKWTLVDELAHNYYGDWSQIWFNYTNHPIRNVLDDWVLRHPMCSRAIMPDDVYWDNTPFQCSDTEFSFAYKSRTSFPKARNCYIANGYEFDLWMYNNISYWLIFPGEELILGLGTDAKSIRACHDMYKYGSNVPYGLDTLCREFIDTAQWDGNGIASDSWRDTPIGWPYPAYGTHNTATYLNTLVQYYKLSNDDDYIDKADDVAGVLLMIQNQLNVSRFSRSKHTDYYRPEFVGGFLPGYAIAYSFGQCDIYTAGWVDAIYGFARWYYETFGGSWGFVEDPFPFPIPCLANSECTIPSVWALIEYRSLNRVPSVPTEPSYVLPFEQSICYTDHGGSWTGDGAVEIVEDDVESTYIGGTTGNVWKHEGRVDRFRMKAWGAIAGGGEGWSTIEWEWNFSITDLYVRDFRTNLYFTIPEWYAAWHELGSNSLKVRVQLFERGNSTAFAEEIMTVMNHADGGTYSGTGGKLVFCNMTRLDSFARGNYTVKLRFACRANGDPGNVLALGWPLVGSVRHLAVGLEWFGIDYTTVVCSMKTLCKDGDDGFFYIPDLQRRSVKTLRVELLWNNTDLEGDQLGGSIEYAGLPSFPDGKVNIKDSAFVNSRFGDYETMWDLSTYTADVYPDREIDIKDSARVSKNYGKSGSYPSLNLTEVHVWFFYENGTDITCEYVDSQGFAPIPSDAYWCWVRKDDIYDIWGAMLTFWDE